MLPEHDESRSIPWQRRPEASALLAELKNPERVQAYLAAIAARPEAFAKVAVLQTLHRDAAASEDGVPGDTLDAHSAYSA